MKKKIVILFGGCSPEYHISLQSAYSVIEHINKNIYESILIGITENGQWLLFKGSSEKLLDNTWMEDKSCVPAILSPNRKDHGILIQESGGIRTRRVDAVFPVLHGKNGEDGTVQGLCELGGLSIAGCGSLSSALCMNKYMAHLIARSVNIKVPKSVLIREGESEAGIVNKIKDLTLPLFVKPVKAGSSFGITMVHSKDDIYPAVIAAYSYDDEVLIEEAIEGFETGCAVLGKDRLIIGEADEIELSRGFFNYDEKYTLATSKIHMPARISPELSVRIKECAGTLYKALGCKGFARVDLFITPKEDIIFNEINTIPGFTLHSRFPGMLMEIGMSFDDIIDEILRQAV